MINYDELTEIEDTLKPKSMYMLFALLDIAIYLQEADNGDVGEEFSHIINEYDLNEILAKAPHIKAMWEN